MKSRIRSLRPLVSSLVLGLTVGCISPADMVAGFNQQLEAAQETVMDMQAVWQSVGTAYPQYMPQVAIHSEGAERVLQIGLTVDNLHPFDDPAAEAAFRDDVMRTALSSVSDRSAYTSAELVLTTNEVYAGGLVTGSMSTTDNRSMSDWESHLELLPSARASATTPKAPQG